MQNAATLRDEVIMLAVFETDEGVEAVRPAEAAIRMNKMYRWQRYIYDMTRRYYLLGRDQLIDGLRPKPGASVLEIGCGTGRNLVHTARHYPEAAIFGFDISTEMLTTAIAAIDRAGLARSVRVAHGDATHFDPAKMFQVARFDHVMICYSLSMIPDWQLVLDNALACLKPGGKLHIVDFGDQSGLPSVAGKLLLRWLALFDVTPRNELRNAVERLAARSGAELAFKRPFRGYAQQAVLTLS
jgi:S-adenosylmethionine-diacylgycerolhomoserine-N-methlytransferase